VGGSIKNLVRGKNGILGSWRYSSGVECLPSKHEALSLKPSTRKKREKKLTIRKSETKERLCMP
jgi:hypothetical protein